MTLDCIMIGFHDEPLEDIIKRVEPYKTQNAGYKHMMARSAFLNGKHLKYSEVFSECISHSIGIPSDLTNFRMPSMPVHYLTNFMRKRGLETDFINFFNAGKDRLEYLLKNNPPNCVGISSTCQYEPEALLAVVHFIRNINPDPAIVVGGPYINSIGFELDKDQQDYKLKVLDADVYVHDLQGEQTLVNLCYELRKPNPDFSTIPNLIYRLDNNKFHRTPRVPEDNDLDADPVIPLTFYEDHPLPSVYVRTARSCPQKCAFCRYPLMGGTHTYSCVETVEKKLDYIHSLGVKNITFVDDSYNVPIDRFKDMCRLMINKNYDFKWFSFFRCSDADEEAFDLMAESGCGGVLLGIESGDTTVLKNMNKQATVEDYRRSIKFLNERNIASFASCMIGFPGETEATAARTIQFIEDAKPTFYDLQAWFYESAVPIAEESEYYNLKGYGYSWEHNTMNWNRAADLAIEGIRKIKNSAFLPAFSFNLWSVGYYLSQGITVEEIKKVSGLFSKLIGKELHEIDDEYRENEKKILSVFKGNKSLEANLQSRVKKETMDVAIEEMANQEFNF